MSFTKLEHFTIWFTDWGEKSHQGNDIWESMFSSQAQQKKIVPEEKKSNMMVIVGTF